MKIPRAIQVVVGLVVVSLLLPTRIFAAQCCPAGYALADGSFQALGACGAQGYDDPSQCCQRTGVFTVNRQPSTTCVAAPPPQLECGWTTLNNQSSPYNGRPAFCVGGFENAEQLQQHSVTFRCTSNCGSVAKSLIQRAFGQVYSLANAVYGYENGKSYTCVTGDFDTQAFEQVATFMTNSRWVRCGAGVGAAFGTGFIAGATGGVASVVATATVPAAALQCAEAVLTDGAFRDQYFPTFTAEVTGGGTCSSDLAFNAEVRSQAEGEADQVVPYEICAQIPNDEQKEDCCECATGGRGLRFDTIFSGRKICADRPGDDFVPGIWTAVGCIKSQPQDIVASIVQIGLGIAGGVAILMILAAAFLFSTSQGDPKRTTQARELVTAAVIGLLFIIFSVTILQFIGVSILQIPDFGV